MYNYNKTITLGEISFVFYLTADLRTAQILMI
jgi:hypothetical protein